MKDLVVIYPRDEIGFGDVRAGATTEYRTVPEGVYGYSAFRYEQGGRLLTQPVIDWMGEVPMMYGSYTYEISVEQSAGIALVIRGRVLEDR